MVRAVREQLRGEHIVYLGDTARVPYGSKSARTVERYALACQKFLLDRDVKLVMIACNTASATALPALEAVSPVPVIGAVIPGATAAAAATGSAHIGVIGTLATVRSGAYEDAIAARSPGAQVTSLACPLLVPLAEEGWLDGGVADAVARRYLSELFERDPAIDTLVLGCTHYPLLRKTLEAVAAQIASRAVAIVDSASAMAALACDVLGNAATTDDAGWLHCYATDATRLDELGPRFLGEPVSRFELVDL